MSESVATFMHKNFHNLIKILTLNKTIQIMLCVYMHTCTISLCMRGLVKFSVNMRRSRITASIEMKMQHLLIFFFARRKRIYSDYLCPRKRGE